MQCTPKEKSGGALAPLAPPAPTPLHFQEGLAYRTVTVAIICPTEFQQIDAQTYIQPRSYISACLHDYSLQLVWEMLTDTSLFHDSCATHSEKPQDHGHLDTNIHKNAAIETIVKPYYTH